MVQLKDAMMQPGNNPAIGGIDKAFDALIKQRGIYKKLRIKSGHVRLYDITFKETYQLVRI